MVEVFRLYSVQVSPRELAWKDRSPEEDPGGLIPLRVGTRNLYFLKNQHLSLSYSAIGRAHSEVWVHGVGE